MSIDAATDVATTLDPAPAPAPARTTMEVRKLIRERLSVPGAVLVNKELREELGLTHKKGRVQMNNAFTQERSQEYATLVTKGRYTAGPKLLAAAQTLLDTQPSMDPAPCAVGPADAPAPIPHDVPAPPVDMPRDIARIAAPVADLSAEIARVSELGAAFERTNAAQQEEIARLSALLGEAQERIDELNEEREGTFTVLGDAAPGTLLRGADGVIWLAKPARIDF